MKKHYITLILITFISISSTFAQIPNATFELWDSAATAKHKFFCPKEWTSNDFSDILTPGRDFPDTVSVVRVAGRNGGFAVGIKTIYDADTLRNRGSIRSANNRPPDNSKTGFPFSGKPSGLAGYYKSEIPLTDSQTISIILWGEGTFNVIGLGFIEITDTVQEWTPFNFNIEYFSTDEVIEATIEISRYSENSTQNSVIYIDDLSFQNSTTSIKDLNETSVSFHSVGNNTFELKSSELFQVQKIAVFNSQGKLLRIKESSNTINVSEFPSGVYILQAQTSLGITSQKIIR
jgi:hypothetical protein